MRRRASRLLQNHWRSSGNEWTGDARSASSKQGDSQRKRASHSSLHISIMTHFILTDILGEFALYNDVMAQTPPQLLIKKVLKV